MRERTLGEAHPDVGVSLTNLGNVSVRLGHPDDAREYFERALALLERALGPEHPDLSICLNNLATHLDNEGDDAEAAALLARALAIKEKTLAPDHPSVATGLSNLADVEFDHSSADLVGEAEYYLARALFSAGNRDAAFATGERARDRLAGVDEVLRDEVEAWLTSHR